MSLEPSLIPPVNPSSQPSTSSQPTGFALLSRVSNCDDCTEYLSLPFQFNFLGAVTVNSVQVSSNGQINIFSNDTDHNCCSADPIAPGNYLKPRIAVLQEDLRPQPPGGIYWKHDLSTGAFIISYDNVPLYGFGGSVNAEVKLF